MPSGGHHFTVVLLGIATALIAGEVHRERIEWCDVWIPQANDSKLPRVLLVGDSITRGYYGRVAAQLANVASVARLTTSRSVCDPLFVAELRPVVEGYKWAVIHFNNGIHGGAYSDEEYREGYRKALDYLRQAAPDARVVCVLSTPASPDSPADLRDRIARRNRIVAELARAKKLPVNDLFTPMNGHREWYRDRFHFKPPAIALQAEQVARTIRGLLARRQAKDTPC